MEEDSYGWNPKVRDYANEKNVPSLVPCDDDHPLLPKTVEPQLPVVEELKQDNTKLIFDPLGVMSAGYENNVSDPLNDDYLTESDTSDGVTPLNWDSKKGEILLKFTTNESLSIPSFVEGVAKVAVPKDKVRERLEQLDQFEEEDGEVLQLGQEAYMNHISKMHANLRKAWDNEQRVRSLKIAIRLVKLLGDTSQVVFFYPSKWVLITEILDTFGNLVFERIKDKAAVMVDGVLLPLKNNFRPEDVGDHAKEICENWFYKISSIRELIPRLYIEMSIMKSYKFLYPQSFYDTFLPHMGKMIRGIGDPLVATYALCYLARKGHEVAPDVKSHLIDYLDDYHFLRTSHISESKILKIYKDQISYPQYLSLYSPSLDWILQCIAYKSDEKLFQSILDKISHFNDIMVLNSVITSFDPSLIASKVRYFVDAIKNQTIDSLSKHEIYKTLGVTLVLQKEGFMDRDEAREIFMDIWDYVSKIKEIGKYISVAEVYIEFPVKHIDIKATDFILTDILKHIMPDKYYLEEESQRILQSIMEKLLANTTNFTELFSLDSFIKFFDLFRGETQVEVNKLLLERFSKINERITDPIIINTMFSVAKVVHDSINAFSFADEVRRISRLISSFITKMEFGKDFERHLSFYTECRRAFANIESVKKLLVQGALNLAIKTNKIMKGNHSKETSSFVRACIAYAYITIPSMHDIFDRLNLYILGGQVALMNQSIPQAESFFKAAITAIQEVPPYVDDPIDKVQIPSEPLLIEFLKNFVSVLISVPGHPEMGPFYLLRGLYKVIKDYKWEAGSTGRAETYISMIILLSSTFRSPFPYSYPNLEGNDILYVGTAEYEEEIQQFIDEIIKDILYELKIIKDMQDTPGMKIKKARISFDFLNQILILTKLNPKLFQLCIDLYILGHKNKTHAPYNENTRKWLGMKSDKISNALHNQFESIYNESKTK